MTGNKLVYADLSQETGQESHGQKEVHIQEAVPCLGSQRWLLAYLGFFGCVSIYAMRVNMSVAIVCMVNDTTVRNGSEATNTSHVTGSTFTDDDDNNDIDDLGEFFWSKAEQSLVLSSYFYGYVSMQIPGGWLSGKLGPKRVLGTGLLLGSILTMLLPLSVRYSLGLVYAMRVLLGFTSGAVYPCFYALWGNWAPPLERTKLTGLCYSGAPVGTILTFSLSGVLCRYGFGGGWPSIFYLTEGSFVALLLTGAFTFLWCLLWFLLVSDTPAQHPRITKCEKRYILDSIGSLSSRPPVPWLAMLTSRPMWGVIIAHIMVGFTAFTLMTGLPMFLNEVHKYDVTENGLLSSVPYITEAVSMVMFGQLADMMRSRGILSTKHTRKLFQGVAFIGAAGFLAGVGFLDSTHRDLVVIILALATLFLAIGQGGHTVNVIDIGPRYAGEMFGIINCAGTSTGIIAPLVIGALTPNKKQDEWMLVFFLCAGLSVLGMLVYSFMAEGEEQPWASQTLEIEVKASGVTQTETEKTPLLSSKLRSDSSKSPIQENSTAC